jgi:hypothetical protein
VTIKKSVALRNAQNDAITTAHGNAALLRFYSGTRPANVAASITGTLLGELTFGTPFAPSSSGGVLTPNAITSDSSADNTGTASHARSWQSNGTTAVMDYDVATSGADININTTAIVSGGPIAVTSFTITSGGA